MSNSIKYITSLTPELYKATGKACLDTWSKYAWGSGLDIYYEGNREFFEKLHSGHPWNDCGLYIDVMKLPTVGDWLTANKNIIPKTLGGDFTCKCKYNRQRPHKGHIKNCAAGSMRRRASQWFRKFASVFDASRRKSWSADVLVWMDTDIVFKKELPEQFILDQLSDFDMAYHMGPTRRSADVGTETGFWIFKQNCPIITEMHKRFMDGTFRKYKRWDEAWMLWEVLKSGKYKAKDLVKRRTSTGHVIEAGPFAPYITHNKGTHWKKGIV